MKGVDARPCFTFPSGFKAEYLSLGTVASQALQRPIDIVLSLLVQEDVRLGDLQEALADLIVGLVDVVDLEDVGVSVVDVGLAGEATHVDCGIRRSVHVQEMRNTSRPRFLGETR